MSRGGVLPVDKPPGPTSHDVVARARRALGTRRIGHTGTLDPFASGLLLLCVGPATRLAEYLSVLPKTYEATLVLGAATDTDDATGTVTAASDAWRMLGESEIRAALMTRVGTHGQVPPAYSAKKVGGARMYDLARRGEAPELAPVDVTVHQLEVTRIEPPEVDFRATCSAGTYIRSIARDIGADLEVFAHLRTLRRTAIGPHRVDGAVPLDALDDVVRVAAAWIDPLDALAHMQIVRVDHAAARALGHGRTVPAPDGTPEGVIAVATGDDGLLAIAESRDALIRPRKVFVDA